MNALLRSLLIFLYPARCRHCGENLAPGDGHYICKSCWQEIKFIKRPFCETCGYPLDPLAALPEKVFSCARCSERKKAAGPWPFRKARSVAPYESAAGEAIRLLKYQGKTVMAKPLGDLIIEAMPRLFDEGDYDYIVPVPLHIKRRRKRGYNQTELIGERLSRAVGIPMETHSLVKIRNTRPQVSLSLEERRQEVRGAFDVSEPPKITGKRILLIDDVFTTGTTVSESARTLAKRGRVKFVDVLTLTRRLAEGL